MTARWRLWRLDPRPVSSTLADETPLAFTVEEIAPGLYAYKYIPLERKSA